MPGDPSAALPAALEAANARFAARFPGEPASRQPVHTVYGGAHLFRSDTASKLGAVALEALEAYAPDARTLAAALGPGGAAGGAGLDPGLAEAVHARVVAKLRREPVEDFRLDFEDGYGHRPDGEEDGHAVAAAAEVARGMAEGRLPPFIGIRIKPLSQELAARAVRTLDLFLTALVERTGGVLPANFVVTLPKVTVPEQVAALADVFDRLESGLGLAPGSLVLELMVETPQAVLDPSGSAALPALVAAGRGGVVGAHFGTYDYTASLSITAGEQRMHHPACVFARQVMQVALAGTGVRLSDGSTAILPVAPHAPGPGGPPLSAEQLGENRATVHRAWKRHYDDVRRSLADGFYQGWDLHPGQLVTRYAAVYAFFLDGLEAAGERLRNFVERAAQATLLGDVFDDAATGQGLLNYFLRSINCGAVTEEETAARTGLTLDELRSRSFARILANRRGASAG